MPAKAPPATFGARDFVLTIALIAFALRLAWRRGHSPLEVVSVRADARVVEALRGRFGTP
jgi:hypothetical protein